MSVVVAVAANDAVALTTESIRVRLPAGTFETGHRKHVRAGLRAAGIAGLIDGHGISVLDPLEKARETAPRLVDVTRHLLIHGRGSRPSCSRTTARGRGCYSPSGGIDEVVALLAHTN